MLFLKEPLGGLDNAERSAIRTALSVGAAIRSAYSFRSKAVTLISTICPPS